MSIISDTLTNATLSPAVNHLATVTKLEPVYEFVGATVDAYLEVPLILSLLILLMREYLPIRLILILRTDLEMLQI